MKNRVTRKVQSLDGEINPSEVELTSSGAKDLLKSQVCIAKSLYILKDKHGM